MQWYAYVALFFGGAFLVNAVPHFTTGVSGRRFPSPFASPPGRGLSSSTVNVLWGTLNLAVGYLLVCHVGEFHFRRIPDVLVLGAGGPADGGHALSGIRASLRRAIGRRVGGLLAADVLPRPGSAGPRLVRTLFTTANCHLANGHSHRRGTIPRK